MTQSCRAIRMTPNSDTDQAWAYHDGTKHSPASVTASAHILDWTNRPGPFKLYRNQLPEVELVTELTPSSGTALRAISALGGNAGQAPTLADLSAILLLSAGITKRVRTPAGPMHFRAAACTGALYHIELYVVAGQIDGLDAGVYHFGVHDATLRQVRAGDHRSLLAEATGEYEGADRAGAVIVYTSTFWRNAWKYQARAYRHSYWDSGTIIANGLAAAASRGLTAHPVVGFVDQAVNGLVGVDGEREATVALMTIGEGDAPGPQGVPGAVSLATEPYSREELDYPGIRRMHEASSLADAAEARAWRGAGQHWEPAPRPAAVAHTQPAQAAIDRSLEEVITSRGSSRRFSREPVSSEHLSTIIETGTAPVGLDVGAGVRLTDLYVIVNAVDGLEPGAFFYDWEAETLKRLSRAETRGSATRLALGQDLGGDAGFNCYFLADLDTALGQFGNRGYRAAQLDASIRAGRMYLAAYGLRLGATGLTFFDDAVTEFFSPHAQGKSVMFLIAVGLPAHRRR